jgi:hypothetical protein
VSCYIHVADDGTPTLEIPDAGGKVHTYSVAPAEPEEALWACTLVRLDSGDTYRVERRSAVAWWCECPAHKFKKRRDPPCKHCLALKGLRAFFRMLFGPAVRAAMKGARGR